MRKKFLIAGLVVVVISLGFLRDNIFVSINKIIEGGLDVSGRFAILKWVLTFLFSLFYLLLTCVFLYLLFRPGKYADVQGLHTDRHRQYIRIAIAVYGFLFAVSFLAALSGYIFASFENTYHFIRTVMGVAQSPVVMMILIVACYLDAKVVGEER